MEPTSDRRFLREFLRDERGSISIEFAVLMPLLLFLTTGGIGFWDAFYSKSRTSKVAYLIGDIMSRHEAVDSTDMAYLYDLENKLFTDDLDQRTLRISSICSEDGEYRVLWSYSNSSEDVSELPALTDEEIPLDIMPQVEAQDSVILTEVSARWEPHFLNIGLGTKTWRSATVSRPRFVQVIPHAQLNTSNICPYSG